MTKPLKKFERKSTQVRKNSLIRATLSLIATEGIDAATVRVIAERANVTQGLIRYYFSTKEELILAAYEYHMNAMVEISNEALKTMEGKKPTDRLVEFIYAALTPPVANSDSVALWAGFLNRLRRDENMRLMHRKTYFEFRNRLEFLIEDVFVQQNKKKNPQQLKRLAIACNAVIDGLWLEGGALPEAFEPGEIVDIGLSSISAIIDVKLARN